MDLLCKLARREKCALYFAPIRVVHWDRVAGVNNEPTRQQHSTVLAGTMYVMFMYCTIGGGGGGGI